MGRHLVGEGEGVRMQEFRPETRLACEAMGHALELAERNLGASEILSKDGRDLVTATDIAIEDAVRERLQGLPIVGEERGGDAPPGGSPYWLVDPICGTGNFAAGIPLYCVNLALVENDEVTVAAVGDASRHEIALAERGRGSWTMRDGSQHRLAASDASSMIVIEDDGGKSQGPPRGHASRCIAEAIRLDRWEVRSLGTSLAMPYLAAGRIAANVYLFVTAVHVAAGSLLAFEAGATLSDIDGRPWSLHSDSLVAAATPDLHRELLELARATA
ncbi:MAG: hypothetical protein GEU73_13350 [Chloroflexi bacterium]|nr:hypothetical protein [Chloroflexota bacterium]